MPSATPEPSASRLVLGVGGGVAAYKALEVLSRLREVGYAVTPVLTPEATRFVAPLSFSALAGEPARTSLFTDAQTPIPHTRLGQEARLIVVAPATAHLIARMAMGLANDLLGATLLATRAPILLCPAMHTEMWEHPSVQENLDVLRRRGVLVLGPAEGRLAGGDEGPGRLVEPSQIVAAARAILEGHRGPLSGRRVVISAGGTREAIDPVRVITNRSSGRQGYALAEVAARLGAQVTLVSAAARELALDVRGRVEVVPVDSAAEMAEAVWRAAAQADAVIMAAAVADFSVEPAPAKLRRDAGPPSLHLVPAPDVMAGLVERRPLGQVLVAFAAETGEALERGRAKLVAKGVDLLVANDVAAPGVGFDHATNEVHLLGADGSETLVSLTSKEAVAQAILDRVAALLA